MSSYLKGSEIQGKITGPWNIGHSDLHKIQDHSHCVKLTKYAKYNAYLLDRARDIRQYHWTMKQRTQWLTNRIKLLKVSDWTSIQSMMPSYLIGPEIKGKITGPWNIGHSDLKNKRSPTVWNWTSTQSMMLIYLVEPEIYGKITRPWNIGHSDLQIVRVHWKSIQSMMPSFLIGSEIQKQNHSTMKYRSQWPTKNSHQKRWQIPWPKGNLGPEET